MAKKRTPNIFKDAEVLWKYVRGVGQWNAFVEPDDYDKWSTNLYGEEVEELEDEMQAFLDEAVAFAKAEGKDVQTVAPLYKEYEGKRYIQFKRVKYDEDMEAPKYYNIHGDEVTGKDRKEVGGGSSIRIRAMIKPYYMATTKTVGLSYKLLAVQVLENKEYTGTVGFGDESGGAEPKETAPFDTDTDTDY